MAGKAKKATSAVPPAMVAGKKAVTALAKKAAGKKAAGKKKGQVY